MDEAPSSIQSAETAALDKTADSPPSPETEDAHRSALLIVFLVVFIDLLGWGIVLPLLPRLGEDFLEGGEKSPWIGMVTGLLMASFSAMQFVFAPIWGRLSDRVGRRPILLMGLLVSVVFNALFGVALEMGGEGQRQLGLILLFVARIGAGIGGATLGAAQAVIADSTTPQRRSRGMALIGAAFGVGFTVGPILGFAAVELLPQFKAGPGVLAALVSLIAFVVGLAILPETLRKGSEPGSHRGRVSWRAVLETLGSPRVGILILLFFLSTYAFAMFETTLALLTKTNGLQLGEGKNYLIFTYVGLCLGLAQGLLYRRLALRVGEVAFMRVGALLMMLGLAALGGISWVGSQPQPPSAGVLIAALMVILAVAITGFAFMTPSVQALVSRRSDPKRQGEILGVNQSANAVARILGPLTSMPLYFLTADHVLPYGVGAALLFVVLLLALQQRQE